MDKCKKIRRKNKTSKADSEASHPYDCLLILDHYVYTPWSGGEVSRYPVPRAPDKLHSFVITNHVVHPERNPLSEVWRFPSAHVLLVDPMTKAASSLTAD